MKFFEKTRGSVSIFLILVLLPIYTCVYLAVDCVRYEAAKSKVYGALSLAGNGALNDYDLTLKQQYGLFVMGRSQSEYEEELSALFSNMVDSRDAEDTVVENMISTQTQSFSVSLKSNSVLARPEVLESCIVDYMKYRAPYSFATGVGQRLGVFSQLSAASDTLAESTGYYDSLSGLDTVLKNLGKNLQTTDVSGEFDATLEQKNLEQLLSGISSLQSKVKGVSGEAANWKAALESMKDGDVKSLLSSDYQSTAEVFSSENIVAFEQQLKQDLEQVKSYQTARSQVASAESGDTPSVPETPTLHYRENPLYSYILSSAGTAASESERTEASDIKSGLSSLASTKTSGFITNVAETSVASACGSAAASIDKLGSSGESNLAEAGNNTLSQLSQVKQFFSVLQSGTEELVDEAFVEEFMTEQFSCYTTGSADESLCGENLQDSPLKQGEVEYILFGKDNLRTNVVLAVDLLFSVRLLLNSIYVYTNAKMRGEALSVASALAGWTGVGVTVAQNLILLLWATGESILDVSTLCKGQSVPLFKNASTWTLSLNGVANTVKNGAASYASSTIDDIFQKIEDLADDKVDDLESMTENYLRQSTEGAAESLTNLVLTPVESTITSLIGNKTTGISGYNRDQVKQMILNAVDSAGGSSKGFQLARNLFVSNYLDSLTDTVYANYEYLFAEDDTLSKVATEKIEDALSDVYENLFDKVENQLEQYASTAKEKIDAALSAGSDKAKSAAVEAIDEYTGKLGTLLGSSSNTETALSGSSGLAMSYKDYLKVFTFVLLVNDSNKTKMLTRTAKVMQANCCAKDTSFDLTACFREIKLTGVAVVAAHRVKESEEYGY